MPSAAPTRIYSCACGGCSFSSEDPLKLSHCSKCKLALYCCRDHQVLHWKQAHKAECFPPEEHNNQAVGYFCLASETTSRAEAAHAAKTALAESAGIALFVGKTSQGRPKIVTDYWGLNDENRGSSDRQVPPDLYLSHIPPALFRKVAEDPKMPIIDSMTAMTTESLCIQSIGPAMNGVDSAMLSQVVRSKPFAIATRAIFTPTKRNEAIQFIRESLQCVDWTLQIPTPARIREQTDCLVGTPLSLEGGIEMLYVTNPAPCFGDLTKSELDWFNRQGREYPVLMSPIVVYRSVEEGWALARVNHGTYVPLLLDPATRFTTFDTDTMFLKVVVAAAEIGDVTVMYCAWKTTKKCAVAQKQEEAFIQATRKLLNILVKVHPHPRREETYFLHGLGELYESRASWLIRAGQDAAEELLSAARCYHFAAMNTHQFSPNNFLRWSSYHHLGKAFLHLEDWEMAKRAFLWSMTDPFARCDKGSARGATSTAMIALWDINQMTEKERRQETKRSLKNRRVELKKNNLPSYRTVCSHCSEPLEVSQHSEKHCAQCLTIYCSRECQMSDWPTHKKICEPIQQNNKRSTGTFARYGGCSESTRELLSAVNWTITKSTMSLSEGAQRANEWKQTQPQRVRLDGPPWMMAELFRSTAQEGAQTYELASGNSL